MLLIKTFGTNYWQTFGTNYWHIIGIDNVRNLYFNYIHFCLRMSNIHV
jgi:hypothetical protein